jgi:NADH-quinone oxidoreductase subunit D
VLRIKLFLDGEKIIKATPYLGYLHRGAEKLLEKLTYVQATPIVDKHDYVSPMTNEQALVMAFEKLLAIEVPRRGRYLRTLLNELQRIASHLFWLGTFTLDIGGSIGGGGTLFLYTFRERESILDIFEDLTGARFHYNTHCIGGNRHDIPAGWAEKVKKAMAHIKGRISEYEAISVNNKIFQVRTRGIGLLPAELGLSLGITGPNLRAAGVDHDLRRDAPYHAYDEVKFKVPTATEGDSLARTKVRLAELRESITIVESMIDGVPEGSICGYRPVKGAGQVKVASGQAYVCIESPRGELGTYVIAGGGEGNTAPYRLKIQGPSYVALSAIPHIVPGLMLSDLLAVLGSLDPIMGEADR